MSEFRRDHVAWCGTAAAVITCLALSSGCDDQSDSSRLPASEQLFLVDALTGERRQLTNDRDAHPSVSWSPDGRRIAFTSETRRGGAVEVMKADGSGRRVILRQRGGCPTAVSWSPTDRLLAFSRSGSGEIGYECAVPATMETMTPAGSGRRRLARFRQERATDEAAGPVWAPDGKRIAYTRPTARPQAPLQLVWSSIGGGTTRVLTRPPVFPFHPRWSPDGRAIAFSTPVGEGLDGLMIVPQDGGEAALLTPSFVSVSAPAWSPAGDSLAFSGVAVRGDRRYYVYVVRPDGGLPKRVSREAGPTPPAWAPKGNLIAYVNEDAVRLVSPDGETDRTLTRVAGAEILNLAWAPGGRRLLITLHEQPVEG